MFRLLIALSAFLLPFVAVAADAPVGLDDQINAAVKPIADAISAAIFYAVELPGGQKLPLIVAWLVIGGVVSTIYFGFINVRGFTQGFRLIRGDYSDPSSPGEVSHFQALTSAVSGTVGLGNIAGVSVAVALGGPGATFWMILAGILGMSTKFAECTLGVKYRLEKPDGTISGGPMYYLIRGISEQYPTLRPLGIGFAIIFALCAMLGAIGAGSMFQANQAYSQFLQITGGEAGPLAGMGWAFGLGMAILCGIVVIGGITRIGRVTEKLIPFMAILYIVACLVVIGFHIDKLPATIGLIFSSAFSTEATYGGLIGALLVGFQRAAFSNEAGLGSSPIAHSAVKTREPVTEGLVALWEPFVDTVIICTMTALVVVITGAYLNTENTGVALTSISFASVISWFPYVLTVAVFLFAFSTMLTWAYYGAKAASFLFNESKIALYGFKVFFLFMAIIACTMDLSNLIGVSDGLLFIMAIPNLIGVYMLMPVVKRELNSYFARLHSGEIKPYRKA